MDISMISDNLKTQNGKVVNMKNYQIAWVTKMSENTDIANAIVILAHKSISHRCKICIKNTPIDEPRDCSNCRSSWFDARNSIIKILRNIFRLPKDRDVPKSIFFLAANEAENIEQGIIKKSLIRGINRLKNMDAKLKLIEQLPENIKCYYCNQSLPPSRFIYIENTKQAVICKQCFETMEILNLENLQIDAYKPALMVGQLENEDQFSLCSV